MARYYAREFVGVLDGTTRPPLLADGQLVNAKERRTRAVINLADRVYAAGDDVVIGKRPGNSYYIMHRLNTSVSLGTTTVALGTIGNTGKYRPAAVLTDVDRHTTAALAAQVAADKLGFDDEIQLLTFGAANPPAAGVVVVETFYTYD